MVSATTVLRPVARARLERIRSELAILPVPPSSARQSAPGGDVDRVLVFGNGPAAGFGVRSQELALPGQLARSLGAATGRGVEVDIGQGRGTTVETTVPRVEAMRLWRYDAVVAAVGATDAGVLLRLDRWEVAIRTLLASVRASTSATTPVVLLGIRPLLWPPEGTSLLDRVTAAHAARMEAVSAAIAASDPHTHVVPLEPALEAIGAARYFTPDSYRAIADHVVAVLAPDLDDRHRTGDWLETRRLRKAAEPEEQRQRAVDELGVVARPATARLQRLVHSASALYGTSGAAVTILDGSAQVNKASVGLEVDELPRSQSICEVTISRDGALVLEDASTDPLTAHMRVPLEAGPLRFYAGYPIESPDGYRLGALCVFDSEARDPSTVDEEGLRDLALRVQNELWDEAGWTPVR